MSRLQRGLRVAALILGSWAVLYGWALLEWWLGIPSWQ